MGWGEAYGESKQGLSDLTSQAMNLGMQKKQMDMQEEQSKGQGAMQFLDLFIKGIGVFASFATGNPLPAMGASLLTSGGGEAGGGWGSGPGY